MRYYTQLTREHRHQIQALMEAGLNQTETAEIIGFHKATISRELRRNRGLRGYRPNIRARVSTYPESRHKLTVPV